MSDQHLLPLADRTSLTAEDRAIARMVNATMVLGVDDYAHLAAAVRRLQRTDRAEAELEAAHAYLSRLLRSYAPDCEPLQDLLGLCTQLDNLITGLRASAGSRR